MMRSRHRITFIAAMVCACGSSKADLQAAKKSLYDTDFAVVYSAALDATRELYPSIDDAPGKGAIRTAWHQVSYANTTDDMANPRTIGLGQGTTSAASQAGGMPTRLAMKRFFIRFDVTVAGGRPWRVKVVGHASEWEPGNALPTELHGPARPPWLDGRTDSLVVAIYKQLRKVAIPMKDEDLAEKNPEDSLPKTDPKVFKNIPAAAGARLAKLKDAVVLRDTASLREQLADDVVWSLGGAPGADTAMAMWQADPEVLDALVRVIEGGCGGADQRVACPPGDPVAAQWQLVISLRGDAWKVTSFVKAE
jgi:hypothetical protein